MYSMSWAWIASVFTVSCCCHELDYFKQVGQDVDGAGNLKDFRRVQAGVRLVLVFFSLCSLRSLWLNGFFRDLEAAANSFYWPFPLRFL